MDNNIKCDTLRPQGATMTDFNILDMARRIASTEIASAVVGRKTSRGPHPDAPQSLLASRKDLPYSFQQLLIR